MRRALRSKWASAVVAFCILGGSCARHQAATHPTPHADRADAIKRSQIWEATDVASKDLLAGPQGPGAFALGATVTCDFTESDMNGRSPKFACVLPGEAHDVVKVKYGADNPEVYGTVLGTRLLWALGFGADRMYSVRVVCRGCPASIKGGEVLPSGERVFDPAAIERKAPGRDIEGYRGQGWSWPELDLVDPSAGGAPVAQRDALKLLAVFMQHADSKPDQQRVTCLDKQEGTATAVDGRCAHPFMFVHDVGLTFGRTQLIFHGVNFVNLARWKDTPIWTADQACIGNLRKAWAGTLQRPAISEAGRQFLADLLGQLTDAQIHDLFAAARVTLRPGTHDTIEDWVAVFKAKRQEVADRRCPSAAATPARK
jgi:hypothetical protein